MANTDLIAQDLDKQILITHKRFQKVMEVRLARMSLDTKERYFAVLSLLVQQLEDREKPLREVLQDTMIAAAPYIAQELSGQ
ncbi:MAG: hypothetical protein ACRERD_25495 [Candidatus Binatia bacterium]